jgi:hypothetical protein
LLLLLQAAQQARHRNVSLAQGGSMNLTLESEVQQLPDLRPLLLLVLLSWALVGLIGWAIWSLW